jgi:hypothetical protein
MRHVSLNTGLINMKCTGKLKLRSKEVVNKSGNTFIELPMTLDRVSITSHHQRLMILLQNSRLFKLSR